MEITADLLKQMVPKGKGKIIPSLIDPLNLVLPYYDITNEYRVCAFLATAAPESDWFQTLREYGKGAGRAYGKPNKITGLVYYGRGIFQNTWEKGYRLFSEYVKENWDAIKLRAGIDEAPDFVANPELLATPYWAVEAACWYWQVNGLEKYADQGLKGFFGLQGLVNRGSAKKKALNYDERLASYETARRVFPDDFTLSAASTIATLPPVVTPPSVATETTPPPTTSTTTITDTLTSVNDKLSSVNTVSQTIESTVSSTSSVGTRTMTGAKMLLGVGSLIVGFVENNWEWLLLAALFAILAAYIWNNSRTRHDG